MSKSRTVYPFTAIVAQDQMKKALLLNAIHFSIGGVLIRGHKGTAKSTAARGLAHLLPEIEIVEGCPFNCHPTDARLMCSACRKRVAGGEHLPVVSRKIRVVDLPLGSSEDRVVGTLDIEHAIKTGEKIFEPGVLAQAHRGILYVDEVNLLDDHIVDILLDAAAMGVNTVEREGVSYSHPAQFILVGTMNPEEGELRPQLLDRFGLCVNVEGVNDPKARVEIVQRCLRFEEDPDRFESDWAAEQAALRATVVTARELLPRVSCGDDMLELAASIAVEMGVHGHRADIAMMKTARAIAACHERTTAEEGDVREAAELVLPHRMRRRPFEQPQVEKEKIDQIARKKKQPPELKQDTHQHHHHDHKENDSQAPPKPDASQETTFEIGETFRPKVLSAPRRRNLVKGAGRRSKSVSDTKVGHYVRSRVPSEPTSDIAFDATLRVAAPHQLRREKDPDTAVKIHCSDIRQKVRERKVGNVIVFVVDASGSMGANRRMAATKGAMMSLLVDAYQKRDKVGLIAFRNQSAELLLPPTSSVELAKEKLEHLPTGGRTPLSQGLSAGLRVIESETRKDPTCSPLMILITDGRGNVAIADKDPFEEAKEIAAEARARNVKSIVVDSDRSFINLGKPQELAEALGAQFFRLDDLSAENLVGTIRQAIAAEPDPGQGET